MRHKHPEHVAEVTGFQRIEVYPPEYDRQGNDHARTIKRPHEDTQDRIGQCDPLVNLLKCRSVVLKLIMRYTLLSMAKKKGASP
jgi:hypothetical protein